LISSRHQLDAPSLPQAHASRRWRLSIPAHLIVDLAIGTIAVLLIASPLLFTSNGFAPDFTSDIWMVSVQEHSFAANLHPTLFLQTYQLGLFDPQFAFYGGTLFALTGALGAILGGATLPAFEIITVAAIAAAYGGLFWIARQLGVRGALAHAPALVFVTSAYYITDLYGRGAWAEFMGVSSFVLVLAAALRLVRGPWRAAPVICLVAASFLFGGSHNITLLLSSTVTVIALACYWLLSGCPRRLPWRRMLAVAAIIALGLGLNGWYLLPDVSYAHDTVISTQGISWSATGFFNTFSVLFDPLRTVPIASTTPALYVQIPVLALIWGLLALPIVWRQRRLRAGAVTALIALIGLLVLILSEAAYSQLPTLFQEIQFPYRLLTYVTLACAGLVLLGVLALTRRAQSGRATHVDRVFQIGLGLVIAFGVALSAWQLWVPNARTEEAGFTSYTNRAQALDNPPTTLPKSWYAQNDFGDHSQPVVPSGQTIGFDAALVENDRLSGFAPLPVGHPFATNILGGPYLVHVGGQLRIVGRTRSGYMVLERTRGGSELAHIELSTQLSAPVVLGRIVTGLSAALLLVIACAGVVRWRLLRRRRVT
jgi:hypothetical protein